MARLKIEALGGGGQVAITLIDTSFGIPADAVSSQYKGNVKKLVDSFNSEIMKEMDLIGARIQRRMRVEIGVYIKGKRKAATMKFWESIFKEVTLSGNKVILRVGSNHPWAKAILLGQGTAPSYISKLAEGEGGIRASEYQASGDMSANLREWMRKKSVQFHYWYVGPKVGRKLKRSGTSRTLFLLTRSIRRQGVLPSQRMYQKAPLPEYSFNTKDAIRTKAFEEGSLSFKQKKITKYKYLWKDRPRKKDYYGFRSSVPSILKQVMLDLNDEIEKRIRNIEFKYTEKGLRI